MAGNSARVADLQELTAIWRGLGLRVVGMAGWEDRGRSATITFDVLGCHHTAAAVDVDRILRDGRPDVPGPLCNVALHADGTVVLVASGRANHFGVATWPSFRALGVEATGPNRTGATGPSAFDNYDEYVKLAAGWCIWKNVDPFAVVRADVAPDVCRVAAHKDVAPDRKIDPAFSMADFRSQVRAAMKHQPTPEDDMPLNDDDKAFYTAQFDRMHNDFVTLLRGETHASTEKILKAVQETNKLLAERLPSPPPPPPE